MKKLLLIGSSLLLCTCLCGCSLSESSTEEKRYQEELQNKAHEEVGMPAITEFTEKKLAKMIWELRDNPKLVTYSYISNRDGKFTYLGQSVGYGLPYSTQYTNPLKNENFGSKGIGTIAQADPNGLYSGDGLSATWVMLMDEKTKKVAPVYVEQELFVSTQKLPRRLCNEDTLPSDY